MPEPIDKLAISMAWLRAMGKCECESTECGHEGRCNKKLEWRQRGKEGPGGWQTRMKNPKGLDRAENWEIFCMDCYKKTGGDRGQP